jgi:hypothetical protein
MIVGGVNSEKPIAVAAQKRVQSRISEARNEVQFREPSRAFPQQCRGSAGGSPSQVDNHPRLHPRKRGDGWRQVSSVPLLDFGGIRQEATAAHEHAVVTR